MERKRKGVSGSFGYLIGHRSMPSSGDRLMTGDESNVTGDNLLVDEEEEEEVIKGVPSSRSAVD